MFCTQCGSEILSGAKYCHNCGNTIADTQQPKISPTTESSAFMDVATDTTKLNGVKGWLLLLCVAMTILMPLFTLGNLGLAWIASKLYLDTFSSLHTLILVDSVLSIGLMVFSIYAGYALWSIKQNAVRTAKAYLLTTLAYSILMPMVIIGTSDPIMDNSIITEIGLKQAFSGIIAFAIWFTYLNRSKRVRTTYDD